MQPENTSRPVASEAGDHDEEYQYGYGERITANSQSILKQDQVAHLMILRSQIREGQRHD